MATQIYDDSYSLFQESSEEWDAPFTGRQPSSHPQSPQAAETQQSHQQHTTPFHYSSDRSPYESPSLPEPSASRIDEASSLSESKHSRKHRSKTRQLYKVKNERTLLQTTELLEQMIHLEKSLESKPISCKPTTTKIIKDTYLDESKGSSSMHVIRRNEPCHTRLSDGIIIPRPKKDQLIQQLEEMEQQFVTEEIQKSPEICKHFHPSDRIALEEWKQSVKERAKRNAVVAASQQLPRQFTTTKPATYHATQSARSPTLAIQSCNRTSLESYTLPSPTSTSSPPRPPTQATMQQLHRTNGNGKNHARRTSLESYTLPMDVASRINPSPRSKSLPSSPLVKAGVTPKNATFLSRLSSVPSNSTKLTQIMHRKQQETREEGEAKRPYDDLRDQGVDRLLQSRFSIPQSSPKLQEERKKQTEPKMILASNNRITSFRRSLVPLQPQKKFSEQGLKTIQEARQKRLQLLQQRQHDAQMTYLAEQRKRMAKLVSGSPVT